MVKETCLDLKAELMPPLANGGDHYLNPGQYQFPFSFLLPGGIPSSCKVKDGREGMGKELNYESNKVPKQFSQSYIYRYCDLHCDSQCGYSLGFRLLC